MALTARHGTPVRTSGPLPDVGSPLIGFTLAAPDLSDFGEEVAEGRRLVLNIFPSIDTRICALSVRRFNQLAADLPEAVVLCVSNDLPMAQARFCGAEGIENVITGSAFRSSFGDDYGLTLLDSPMRGLLARAVIVTDTKGQIVHTELVPDIGTEPDYDAALAALQR